MISVLLKGANNIRSWPLLLLVGSTGCSPDGTEQVSRAPGESIEQWTIVEDLRIGAIEGSEAETFSQIRGILVDRQGQILVLDFVAQEIRVFSPEGAHMATLGRKGSGPGEFRQANGMAWATDGNLYVNDPRNGRVMVLSTGGQEITTYRRFVSSWGYTWEGGVDSLGRLYDYAIERTVRFDRSPGVKVEPQWVLVRYDPATQGVDTISFPQGEVTYLRTSRGAVSVPFAPGNLYAFEPSIGHIWFAHTATYRITEATLDGDTVRVFERDVDPEPLTAADRESAMESLARIMEGRGHVDFNPSMLPSHKPVLRHFFRATNGQLWVRLESRDTSVSHDVFNSEGVWIAQARVPSSYRPYPRPVVTDRYFYAVTTDSLGVSYVVRGRIDRER